VTGATLSSLFFAPYGLLGLQLDDEALRNGTAQVVAASGIMPDGTPFLFPDGGPPPPLRVAEIFSPTQSSHILMLALPQTAPGRANCATDESASASLRFSTARREIADETTGTDERTVQIARENFRLLLDSEPSGEMVTLPIARVQRDGAGHFVYDYGYVGPCLRLSASRRLRELAARTSEMLESRSDAVMLERAAAGTDRSTYAPREIAGFWFLHALNSAIPQLRHSLRTGTVHPEQFYVQLCQLAGALCTFSMTSHPRELPAYDHDAPEQCFADLERHIRRHLDVIMPSDAVLLPLVKGEESFYSATVRDNRCLEPGARWFLGVSSSGPAGDIIARVGRLVKICSAKFVARLVKEAYPGLTLEHLPVPPPEISPRIGAQYFSIQCSGQCWKSILDTREVGLYIPAAIPDPDIELKVVLEGRDRD
jgi:type VI secretion system protein ImpJ